MATLACTPIERTVGPSWLTERRWPPVLLLAGLCAFLFFYGLDAGELYRTEGLRAIVAAEFLRTGDWITPRLYGEPLLTKPPAAYAAIALASWPFGGVTEWTARLPSAAAATLVVFLVYGCFRRHFGRLGGLIAAAVLPASMMWLAAAPSAEIDMLQLAWVAGAVLCFVRAVECNETADQPTRGMAVDAGGAAVRGRRGADEVDGAGILLPDGDPVSPLAAAALPAVELAAPAERPRGQPALHRLGGGGRLSRRLGAAPRHGEPRGAATPVAAAPRAALPVGRGRGVSAAVPGGEPAVVGRGAADAASPASPGCGTSAADGCCRRCTAGYGRTCCSGAWFPATASATGLPLQPGLAGLAAMVWIAWLTGRLRWPLPRIKPGTCSSACWRRGWWSNWRLCTSSSRSATGTDRRGPRRNRSPHWCRKGRRCTCAISRTRGFCFTTAGRRGEWTELDDLDGLGRPVYCVLTAAEWKARPGAALLRLRDEQGDPIVLRRVGGE